MSGFLSGKDYLALPHAPTPWVIEHLVQASGLTNIYGKPKAGKSFAAMGMADAVASGKSEWLGFPVHVHGPVAVLQVDTPRSQWGERYRDMEKAGLDLTNVWTADQDLIPGFPFNILDPNMHAWLKAEMAKIKPVMVIVDTLREIHALDENESTAMRNVLTGLIGACRPAALVMLSHARKDGDAAKAGAEDMMGDNRGSSYIPGKMDVIIRMATDGEKATGMSYKGRSAGQGKLKLDQDPATGLITLDAAETAYWRVVQEVVLEMRAADPDVSVRKMGLEVVSRSKGYKKDRTAQDNVKTFLKTKGVPQAGFAQAA